MPTINFNIPNDLYIGGNLYIQGTLVNPNGGGGGGASSGIPTLNGLSGALTLAGRGTVAVSTLGTNQILISGDPSISGYVNSVSGGLQAQIAGGGTQVKISGSSVLSIADFTGIGGAIVLYSGGKVFISGGAGGGGGGGVTTLNSIAGTVRVVATGGLVLTTASQDVIISGDPRRVCGPASTTDNVVALWDGTSGNLLKNSTAVAINGVTSSAGSADAGKVPLLNGVGQLDSSFGGGGGGGSVGSGIPSLNGLSGGVIIIAGTGGLAVMTGIGLPRTILISGDQSISGYANGFGVSLSGKLTSTGQQALLYAAGIGTIISGNLTSTGVQLGAKIDGLSGFANQNFVHRTGNELISGVKDFQSEARINSSLKVAGSYFGSVNYTFGTGDYIIVATGAVANVTGILPDIRIYSGNVFTVINSRTIALPISGNIGLDRNPFVQPYDSISVYGCSGLYNYIRQTGVLTIQPKLIQFAISDQTTALTAGVGKMTFRMPYPMTLTGVRASVAGAPAGSTIIFDINQNGTTVLSTKLTIDSTEKTSLQAATPAVISVSALADDDEMSVDIDQVGSTNAGTGAMIALLGI